MKRVKIENRLFIFTVCVKSVPIYHFKFAYVVLHMAVNEFFETSSKNGEIGCFNLESHFSLTLKISCSVLLNSYPEF